MIRTWKEFLVWLIYFGFASVALGPAGIILADLLLLMPIYMGLIIYKR